VETGVKGAQMTCEGGKIVRTGVPSVDTVELQPGAFGGEQGRNTQERLMAGEPGVVARRCTRAFRRGIRLSETLHELDLPGG
jgi:hypothetical protein